MMGQTSRPETYDSNQKPNQCKHSEIIMPKIPGAIVQFDVQEFVHPWSPPASS